MAISTVLTIGGVTYSAAQRAAAHVSYTGWTLNHHSAHDVFTFVETHKTAFPTWDEWAAVALSWNASALFSGRVVDTQTQAGPKGWTHAYTAYSLRFLADKLVPVENLDGSGTVVYNRPPTDLDYYLATDSGLSVGAIIARVLTVPATAARLNALGVGAYTSLTPPTLPASTVADLALLTVVPVQAVQFSGANLLSSVDALIARWCPRFVQRVRPSGLLRYRDTTDLAVFVPKTITLPSMFGSGDPVYGMCRSRRSSADCATRMVVRGGPKVEAALLSLVDGTLAEGFTSGNKAAWTLYDYTTPKGASDYGTVTAMTSTSATILSHDAAFTTATNFWSAHQAVATLIDPLATGIAEFESRTITASTAMSAGGSATITWDASVPTSSAAYSMYRIVGAAAGLNTTWRDYLPREPATGATGLATFVGSRLVKRSSRPVSWANAHRSFSEFTSQAAVVGSLNVLFPAVVEPVPSQGLFRFREPTVTVFGQTSKLQVGSPTTVADGLPVDVQVLALYSRGALTATYPPDVSGVPQYTGTAAAVMGVTEYLDVNSWDWYGDNASMTQLAQEHVLTTSNVEYDLSVSWDVDSSGAEPPWAYLDFEYSLNIAVAGTTSPWSGVNAIPQTVHVDFNAGGADLPGLQRITFEATTRRRPFTGDDLYVHPRFAAGTPLGNVDGSGSSGQLFDMLSDRSVNRDATADYMAGQNALLANAGSIGGATFADFGVNMDLTNTAKTPVNEQLERAQFQTRVKQQDEANQRLHPDRGLPASASTPEKLIAADQSRMDTAQVQHQREAANDAERTQIAKNRPGPMQGRMAAEQQATARKAAEQSERDAIQWRNDNKANPDGGD